MQKTPPKNIGIENLADNENGVPNTPVGLEPSDTTREPPTAGTRKQNTKETFNKLFSKPNPEALLDQAKANVEMIEKSIDNWISTALKEEALCCPSCGDSPEAKIISRGRAGDRNKYGVGLRSLGCLRCNRSARPENFCSRSPDQLALYNDILLRMKKLDKFPPALPRTMESSKTTKKPTPPTAKLMTNAPLPIEMKPAPVPKKEQRAKRIRQTTDETDDDHIEIDLDYEDYQPEGTQSDKEESPSETIRILKKYIDHLRDINKDLQESQKILMAENAETKALLQQCLSQISELKQQRLPNPEPDFQPNTPRNPLPKKNPSPKLTTETQAKPRSPTPEPDQTAEPKTFAAAVKKYMPRNVKQIKNISKHAILGCAQARGPPQEFVRKLLKVDFSRFMDPAVNSKRRRNDLINRFLIAAKLRKMTVLSSMIGKSVLELYIPKRCEEEFGNCVVEFGLLKVFEYDTFQVPSFRTEIKREQIYGRIAHLLTRCTTNEMRKCVMQDFNSHELGNLKEHFRGKMDEDDRFQVNGPAWRWLCRALPEPIQPTNVDDDIDMDEVIPATQAVDDQAEGHQHQAGAVGPPRL